VDEVTRFVARSVADPQLAADLTAEVFLAAIEQASDMGFVVATEMHKVVQISWLEWQSPTRRRTSSRSRSVRSAMSRTG
jgi:hypothetical protein